MLEALDEKMTTTRITMLRISKITMVLIIVAIFAYVTEQHDVASASHVGPSGGPVVLMNIDGEDRNGTGTAHGGKMPYTSVVNDLLANVHNGGSGILVIGGGSTGSDVREFWLDIGSSVGEIPTFVTGAVNIAAQSFTGYKLIAVASGYPETNFGGLTISENNALTGRAGDIATHVNNGGGLFGMTQSSFDVKYGYLGSIGGGVTVSDVPDYDNVAATPAGLDVGITNTNMDVCCWHDIYVTYPSFLSILATRSPEGGVAALGGIDVVIPEPDDECDCTKSKGFWKQQFDQDDIDKGKTKFTEAELLALLAIVNLQSSVFNTLTIADANNILNPSGSIRPGGSGPGNGSKSGNNDASATASIGSKGKKKKGSKAGSASDGSSASAPTASDLSKFEDQALAQTLAAWLNFAKGSIEWDEQIDIDGDSVGDITFGELIVEVEMLLNLENPTQADLELAKNLAEAVNLHDENNPECLTGSGSGSGSSGSGTGKGKGKGKKKK